MAKERACGKFCRLHASNRTRSVVFSIVNNNEYKLDCTPSVRHENEGEVGSIPACARPAGARLTPLPC
jgi:hypothetical protein